MAGDQVRLAIIGTGWMGRIHAAAMAASSDIELVGVADVSIEQARTVGKEFGVPGFSSTSELLRDGAPQGVVVATPPAHHRAVVHEALAAGVAVLCEKPLAHDLDTMEELVAAAESTDVATMIGFPARFTLAAEEVGRLREAGELGDIEHVRTNFRFSTAKHDQSHGSWAFSKADGGGALLESSPHLWDLVRFFTGQDAVEVYGLARHYTDRGRAGSERVFTAIARMSGGALATVDMACTLPWGSTNDKRTEIFGTKGFVYVDEFTNFLTVNTEAGVEETPGNRLPGTGHPDMLWHSKAGGGVRRELDHFARCLRAGDKPSPSFRDGLEASLMAHAVDRSIREGRPIQLDGGE